MTTGVIPHGRVVIDKLRKLADDIEAKGIDSVGYFILLTAEAYGDDGLSVQTSGNVPPVAAIHILESAAEANAKAVTINQANAN